MIKSFREFLKKFFTWMGRTFDFSDFFGLCGLGGVFYGLYIWQPKFAFIIVGGIVFLLAIFAGMQKPNKPIS